MKVLKNIFFFALVMSFIIACKSDPKSAFIKKWKVDAEATVKGFPDEVKKNFEAAGKEMMDKYKADMAKITMEFKKDGSFESLGSGNDTKGKWKLSEDGKTLITSNDGGKEDKASIVESSASKIVLEVGEGPNKFKMVLIPA